MKDVTKAKKELNDFFLQKIKAYDDVSFARKLFSNFVGFDAKDCERCRKFLTTINSDKVDKTEIILDLMKAESEEYDDLSKEFANCRRSIAGFTQQHVDMVAFAIAETKKSGVGGNYPYNSPIRQNEAKQKIDEVINKSKDYGQNYLKLLQEELEKKLAEDSNQNAISLIEYKS